MQYFPMFAILTITVFICGTCSAWEPPLEPGQDCRPNQLFLVDCNRCLCTPEGKKGACVRMICPPASCNDQELKVKDDQYCVCKDSSWYCPITSPVKDLTDTFPQFNITRSII